MKNIAVSFLICLFIITGCAQNKDYVVTIKTNHGDMIAILYDETPKHKENFIKLAKEHYFDSILFHRVIQGFMIQGGDPNSRNAKPGERLGSGGGDMERIPFEFKPNHIHRKGALAAARDGNPEKKSSACQFYIVQGKKLSEEEITATTPRNQMDYTTNQRADYMILGGTPRLDNNYTVFGEVIDNLQVIDEIVKQPRDEAIERPKVDIKMTMKVKKMRKKKITKEFGYKYSS